MRGYAVFVVNEKERNSGFKEREGAAKDSDNIQRSFCSKLGFELLNQNHSRDLKKSQWIHDTAPNGECNCLTCKIRNTDHSRSECFLLVISTHGREDKGRQIIRFSDGKKVYLDDLMDSLSDVNCPSLKGIPRILIIQACRTNNKLPEEQRDDPGILVEISNLNISENTGNDDDINDVDNTTSEVGQGDQQGTDDCSSSEESDVDDEDDDFDFPRVTPNNFLIVYPASSGKRSKRNKRDGSWLIVELCEVIDKYDFETRPDMNFLEVLTKTAGQVAKRETKTGGFKNNTCIVHKLLEPLIFKDSNVIEEAEPSDQPAL